MLITIVIIILAIFAYVMIKNPLGIGDMVKSALSNREVEVDRVEYENYDHPLLNEEQEAMVIKSDVDINKIPTEITAEQQECGIDKLGEERILEITNGDAPSSMEMLRLLPCL